MSNWNTVPAGPPPEPDHTIDEPPKEIFFKKDLPTVLDNIQSAQSNTIDSEDGPTLHDWLTLLQTNHDTGINNQIENIDAAERAITNLIAQEANKAQLAIIDRLARELEAEQSIEVNKDDTGLNYYYTIKSVEWAIERIRNQVTADKEQADG